MQGIYWGISLTCFLFSFSLFLICKKKFIKIYKYNLNLKPYKWFNFNNYVTTFFAKNFNIILVKNGISRIEFDKNFCVFMVFCDKNFKPLNVEKQVFSNNGSKLKYRINGVQFFAKFDFDGLHTTLHSTKKTTINLVFFKSVNFSIQKIQNNQIFKLSLNNESYQISFKGYFSNLFVDEQKFGFEITLNENQEVIFDVKFLNDFIKSDNFYNKNKQKYLFGLPSFDKIECPNFKSLLLGYDNLSKLYAQKFLKNVKYNYKFNYNLNDVIYEDEIENFKSKLCKFHFCFNLTNWGFSKFVKIVKYKNFINVYDYVTNFKLSLKFNTQIINYDLFCIWGKTKLVIDLNLKTYVEIFYNNKNLSELYKILKINCSDNSIYKFLNCTYKMNLNNILDLLNKAILMGHEPIIKNFKQYNYNLFNFKMQNSFANLLLNYFSIESYQKLLFDKEILRLLINNFPVDFDLLNGYHYCYANKFLKFVKNDKIAYKIKKLISQPRTVDFLCFEDIFNNYIGIRIFDNKINFKPLVKKTFTFDCEIGKYNLNIKFLPSSKFSINNIYYSEVDTFNLNQDININYI